METKITKIYLTHLRQKLTEDEVKYLVMSNHCFVRSVNKLTRWNWIVSLEYDDYENLKKILRTTEVRGKPIMVKRVFKSITFRPNTKQTTIRGFLVRNIMGIEDIIKVPVTVRVTTNNANYWQHEMVNIWQQMLDTDEFSKRKISAKVDIRPDGMLNFVLAGGKTYLITYFNESIDEYTKLDDNFPKELVIKIPINFKKMPLPFIEGLEKIKLSPEQKQFISTEIDKILKKSE